jgi:hypothetical protein
MYIIPKSFLPMSILKSKEIFIQRITGIKNEVNFIIISKKMPFNEFLCY